MQIAEFLLARIAEDEEWARPASGILGMDVAWHRPDVLHERGINRADAHHIARWDPARVLAECEAKRRLLAAIQAVPMWPDKASAMAMDRAVGAMAAVYADHPDYDPAWSPLQAHA